MELITNVEFVHCSPLAPFMSNTLSMRPKRGLYGKRSRNEY